MLGDRAGVSKCDANNHIYGMFTAAKERVVEAGRKRSAAMSIARARQALVVGDLEESAPLRKSGKKRKKNGRTRRCHSGGVLSMLWMWLTAKMMRVTSAIMVMGTMMTITMARTMTTTTTITPGVVSAVSLPTVAAWCDYRIPKKIQQ